MMAYKLGGMRPTYIHHIKINNMALKQSDAARIAKV